MKLDKRIIRQKIKDNDVFYDPESSNLYSLNEVGKFIFDRVVRDKKMADIVTELVEVYDVSVEKAEEDVSLFMKTLLDEKLIK
jgi:hypothetical protein